MRATKRVGVRGAILTGLLVLAGLAAPGQAQAQFGMGFGFGFETRPMSVENIYSRSNMAAGYSYSSRQQGLTAPSRPRDVGWMERNSAESRGDVEARAALQRRVRDLEAQNRTQPTAPAAPQLALASFFNEYGKLVWPSDSPVSGDLQGKRDISDQASKSVLDTVKARGAAPLGSVTDARNKLLDYGRPALKIVRDKNTAVISEGFHAFLMALYESLAQAATPAPTSAPPTRP